MSTFEFQLHFQLPDGEADPELWLDALFEAGCDDALVGLASHGYLSLDFNREAPTAWEALQTAVRDVKTAIPEARLVSAGPDLLNLSELAELMTDRLAKVTRQAMRKYAKGEVKRTATRFPSPRVSGGTPLWHADEVLAWMMDNRKIQATSEPAQSLITLASAIRMLNSTKEYHQSRAAAPELIQKAEQLLVS
ncbi:MAG: DNA-binding protein [Alcanivorax sp.]|uniref:DNA-binding protein n=1 Tax=Alloalcanivorax gelatiniphagus TaxID=1194167 RepID=A0ABY2XMJ4_9GAMM|nr:MULTISPECIES: DNA-binding protein [Alloalcanivorax]MBM7333648.1 DNA-binding protein [Alloalcanivorax marinus]TMW13604.1 DNA-binding protein [Alloalcanivorax gelatiniphagus]